MVVGKGFDRDIDYIPMKKNLIKEFNVQYENYKTSKYTIRTGKRLVYLLIEMIQLRNGSRVTEAINAFKKFADVGIKSRVIVKICKSESIKKAWILNKKTNCKEKKDIVTKIRMREMMFPIDWIKTKRIEKLIKKLYKSYENEINDAGLRRNIFKYMDRNFDSNTHSLRYAFINHLIYVEKRPLNDVAKFVGHVGIGQLITYTQMKNCNQIFDLDI